MSKVSKRSFEGYLEIDHRESPGISQDLAARNVSGGMLSPIPVGAGRRVQMVTKKCGHCPRMVVMNPDRTRDRGYCSKHDGFICDDCYTAYKITGICRPWKQQVDEYRNAMAKGLSMRVTPRGIILP